MASATIDDLHQPLGLGDLQADALVTTGQFFVGPLANGSTYPVLHSEIAGFELLTAHAAHARKAADLLNFAAHQMVSLANWETPDPVKPAPLSAIQRAAAIGADLQGKRAEVARLEQDAGDPSAGRSPQQGISGGAERVRHDALLAEIDQLTRELASLEAVDAHS